MRHGNLNPVLDEKTEVVLHVADTGLSGVRVVSVSEVPTSTRSGLHRKGGAVEWISAACVALGLVFWGISLPRMDADELNNFGLFSILPVSFWAALCLATAGFALSLDTACRWKVLRPLSVCLLVLLLHATPPIVYETLRYSWAWKHIGIVDYIQRHGHVDREAPFLAAYHNWPFFFWLSSKIANLLKLGPLQIAEVVRFFPVLSNLFCAGLLFAIFRRFTEDFRLVWAAIWIFLCANWVGQDYFSPQAFAYALYLLILALCLGPLAVRRGMPAGGMARRLFALRGLVSRGGPKLPAVSPAVRIASVLAVGTATGVMVASHQLTPLMLISALLSLSLLAGLSLSYAALAALAVASWLVYPAAPFTAVVLPEEVDGVMRAWQGITDKFVDTSAVDPEVAIVAWGGRLLTLGVTLLAVIGWLRRIRFGGRDGAACALLVAPVPILLVTSYGGEAIFRIFLFCVPFLSFFAAALFFPTNTTGRGLTTRLAFATLALAMSVGFLFGNNGKDRQYRFSPEEVVGAHWLYKNAPAGTLLVEGARSYPSQFMNYENFTYVPLANERRDERERILAAPASVLSRWFQDPRWSDGYVIITRSQKAYVEALGIIPKSGLDEIELALLASSDFQLVYANRDVRIFSARRFLQNGVSHP